MKKLHKSKDDKVFAGIIGGIGDYFKVDPTILRLAWLLILVFTAFIPGLIIYIVATLIVPSKK
ncbi:MAG: PspC domain-containing protein [Candidatus Marinimicrobia bacterium]|nr:PspC domain-containing protein [Candidatus Neomarinimicrobiota bacterium]